MGHPPHAHGIADATAGACRVSPADSLQNGGQQVAHLRRVAFEAERLAVLGGRRLEPTQARERVGQVVVGVRKTRVEADGLARPYSKTDSGIIRPPSGPAARVLRFISTLPTAPEMEPRTWDDSMVHR